MEKGNIRQFCPKGYGVAVTETGAEVEVAHTVVGDQILFEWTRKKRTPHKGRLSEVLVPSADRVEPRCIHAKMCGGCSWQQMDYAAQLREKQARVKKAFGEKYPVDPILSCDSPWGYRNKMEFTFSENRAGTRFLGLMIAQAEPYVFNLTECHLVGGWVAEVVAKVRLWWEERQLKAYHPPEDTGALRYLTVREGIRTGHKMVVLNVSGNPDYALHRADLDALVQVLGDGLSVFLRIHQTKKGRPTQFFEMHLAGPDHIVEELHLKGGKLSFKISPISFFQPNTLQAEKLYDLALSFLEAGDVVYDLYCGTGTLAMGAAHVAKEVVGIELSPEAVLDAEENAVRNQKSNVKFYQGDVGQVLEKLSLKRPDAIFIDPPRAGLDPLAIQHIVKLAPRKIIYVSCNPLTQAENVEALVRSGYRVKRLQPVDQFPHTYHIENVAFLER
jgi:23S rRNA (uracil1939-C5)-methyltransferase